MKATVIFVFALSVSVPIAFSQAPSVSKNADNDWAGLTTLRSTPVSNTVQGRKKPFADISREKADAAKAVADAAKKFYTDHPNHVNAADARRIEAVHGLLGVTESDRNQEAAALQVARRYRADRTNPVASRFEVALLVERTEAKGNQAVRSAALATRQLEQIADKLRTEFGDTTEVFNFYVSVARGADMNSANALATRVTQMPSATRDAKLEAQAILDRHKLLTKPLGWTLPEVDKKDPLNLSQPLGKPTVIFLSVYDETGDNFDSLVKYKKNLPASVQLVYLTLGATEEQVRKIKSTAPIAGIHCFESRGAVGPSAEQFLVRQTPYVYVLNRSGVLSGYGPLAELPNLLTAANR